MFKHALFVSLLVCASKLAVAVVPPACILSCVNTQENPADLESVCGSAGSKAVQTCLLDTCPDFVAKEAPQYFASVCKDAGHQIVLVSPSSTSSSVTSTSTSATGTSTSKPTSTSESSTDDDEDSSKSDATTSASADATEETAAAGKEDEDSGAPSIALSQTALAVALLGVSSFIAMI